MKYTTRQELFDAAFTTIVKQGRLAARKRATDDIYDCIFHGTTVEGNVVRCHIGALLDEGVARELEEKVVKETGTGSIAELLRCAHREPGEGRSEDEGALPEPLKRVLLALLDAAEGDYFLIALQQAHDDLTGIFGDRPFDYYCDDYRGDGWVMYADKMREFAADRGLSVAVIGKWEERRGR